MQLTDAVDTVERGLMPIRQAAQYLGISTVAVCKAKAHHHPPCWLVLGNMAVHRDSLEAYKRHTSAVGPKGGRPRKVL